MSSTQSQYLCWICRVFGFPCCCVRFGGWAGGSPTAPLWTFPRPCRPSRLTALEDTLKTGAPRLFRRSVLLAAVGILALVLTACRGVGGGQLPPNTGFTAPASFGFSFSCEDKGGLNPPTGQLAIQLVLHRPRHQPPRLGVLDPRDRRPDRPGAGIPDLYRSESASRRERADLPGPLPADVVRPGGLPVDLPGARDEDHTAVPLRGHRPRQRHEPRPVAGRLLLHQAHERYGLDLPIPDPATVFYARAGLLSSGNLTVADARNAP